MVRIAVILARVLLALPFVVFGLNTVMATMFGSPLFEMETGELPERGQAWLEGMGGTGFALEVLGLVQLVGGLLVLSGAYTPLGLVLLAPVLVHIALFHQLLDPDLGTRVLAWVLVALALFLAWTYRVAYRGLLRPTWLPKPEGKGR